MLQTCLVDLSRQKAHAFRQLGARLGLLLLFKELFFSEQLAIDLQTPHLEFGQVFSLLDRECSHGRIHVLGH